MRATESYARAFVDAARMRDMGLPVVEHQRQALEKAATALDAARPGSTRDLASALQHDPDSDSRRAMTEAKGLERASSLVAGMERERAARLDPNVRAERLVARWNGLEQEHAKFSGRDHMAAREKIEQRMRGIADEIGRDAQVESVLRQNHKALKIGVRSPLGRALRQEKVGEALEQSLERGLRQRAQSLGHGM